jgi:5-methyltetrahydrofolate--homocysteine methyltransferase
VRSDVPLAPDVPVAPFFGHKLVEHVPLGPVFDCLDLKSLYRLSWGAKNTHGEAYEALLRDEFEPRLASLKAQAEAEGWLTPRYIYGYYPAQADGNQIVVFDPTDRKTPIARFDCPRQPDGEHLCLADYVSPLGGDRMDLIGLQVVTVGTEAEKKGAALNAAGDYSASYFLHGLAVQTAEALAEYAHRQMLEELGIPGRGKRYSWGYPAIPSLADHEKVFAVLPVERELGVSLTEAHQLVPEASTAAIVLFHPACKYYAVRGAEGAVAVW